MEPEREARPFDPQPFHNDGFWFHAGSEGKSDREKPCPGSHPLARGSMKVHCPLCRTPFIKQVSRNTLFESLLRFLRIYSFRCQVCAHGFVKLVPGLHSRVQRLDHRQYFRLQANVPATFLSDTSRQRDLVTELSMGGCTLKTDVALVTGSFIQVNLETSDQDLPIAIETGMVRTIRPLSVGIEFLEFQPSEKRRLGEYIRGLLLTHPPTLEPSL